MALTPDEIIDAEQGPSGAKSGTIIFGSAQGCTSTGICVRTIGTLKLWAGPDPDSDPKDLIVYLQPATGNPTDGYNLPFVIYASQLNYLSDPNSPAYNMEAHNDIRVNLTLTFIASTAFPLNFDSSLYPLFTGLPAANGLCLSSGNQYIAVFGAGVNGVKKWTITLTNIQTTNTP